MAETNYVGERKKGRVIKTLPRSMASRDAVILSPSHLLFCEIEETRAPEKPFKRCPKLPFFKYNPWRPLAVAWFIILLLKLGSTQII
jgi:hypothetical protein